MPAWHFVGGKGGVGKTTCATALALRSARRRRTLLVSTDPASSLTDALGVRVGSDPAPIARAGHLSAANLDASLAFERWIAPRRALLASIALRGTYLDEADVGRLLRLSLPGLDEIVGLLGVVQMASGGDYDEVVVDTAPTGHTLRLLAAPSLLGSTARLLDAFQSHHREIVSAVRGAYVPDAADRLIADLEDDGSALIAMLRDPSVTRLSWVTHAEPMALEETTDAVQVLEAAGLRPHHADRQSARPGHHRVLRVVPCAPPVSDQGTGAARPQNCLRSSSLACRNFRANLEVSRPLRVWLRQ